MQGRSRNGAKASFVSRTTSNFSPASRRPISRLPCGFRPRCVAYPPPVAPFRVHLLHHVPLSTSGQKAALISSNLGCLFTVCKPQPSPPAPGITLIQFFRLAHTHPGFGRGCHGFSARECLKVTHFWYSFVAHL
ncbi:hypothetical protein B0H13DRAFT_2349701 [Mycena leptocephala]|nr:hypothetical protein B0H13DRAFT_2349701 [Mycena leptocephala]